MEKLEQPHVLSIHFVASERFTQRYGDVLEVDRPEIHTRHDACLLLSVELSQSTLFARFKPPFHKVWANGYSV